MLMTYAPRESVGSSASILNVLTTSATSVDICSPAHHAEMVVEDIDVRTGCCLQHTAAHTIPGGMSGRLPVSSPIRKLRRCSSSQAL